MLLASILFSGCSDRPVITDNSTLVVQPGLGISNVLTLGMTYEQIRKATGDAKLVHTRRLSLERLFLDRGEDRVIKIQSLGAITAFPGTSSIASMTFYVATNDENEIPFSGKLGD